MTQREGKRPRIIRRIENRDENRYSDDQGKERRGTRVEYRENRRDSGESRDYYRDRDSQGGERRYSRGGDRDPQGGERRYSRGGDRDRTNYPRRGESNRLGRADEEPKERQPKERSVKKIPTLSKEFKTSGSKGNLIEEELRLNRYIAKSGVCSRRDADILITEGRVKVNGEVVQQVGSKVKREDKVEVDDVLIIPEKKVYLLLNKPKDYVTTMEDPMERHTVMALIEGACPERIYPVGRLDRQTTGVLLFTNDGDLATKLTHPKYNHKKIYHVFLDKNISLNDIESIREGVELEDGVIKADDIQISANDQSQVGIEIHSGKNRVVRRIFEHLGYTIIKLDRVYFAGLTKKNLPRGKWRFLTREEVDILKFY